MTDIMEVIGVFIIIFTIICSITGGILAWDYWKVLVPEYEKSFTEGDVRLRFLVYVVPAIVLSALGSIGAGVFLIVMSRVARAIVGDEVLDGDTGAVESG